MILLIEFYLCVCVYLSVSVCVCAIQIFPVLNTIGCFPFAKMEKETITKHGNFSIKKSIKKKKKKKKRYEL